MSRAHSVRHVASTRVTCSTAASSIAKCAANSIAKSLATTRIWDAASRSARCFRRFAATFAGAATLLLGSTFVGTPLVATSHAQEPAAPERVLYEDGDASALTCDAAPWSATRNGLEGRGPGGAIWSRELLGAGDFVIRARLVLVESKADGAAAFLIGEGVFGFDGPRSAPYVDGRLFGARRVAFAAFEKAITLGKPFELDVRRSADVVSLSIDGKQVHQAKVGAQPLGRFGFTPGRGVMLLQRFSVRGRLEAPLPMVRDAALSAQVDAAVARGVEWLVARQQRDGSWRCMQQGFAGGQTGLALYTLLRCGLSVDHPAVERGFAYLADVTPGETYSVSLMMLAYEATRDPRHDARLKQLLALLIEWVGKGEWGYPRAHVGHFERWLPERSPADLSNTQYAVLGLRAAHHAGLDVPADIWRAVVERTLDMQEKPIEVDVPLEAGKTGVGKRSIAGFRYRIETRASMSMTAAGVSVIEIALASLGPQLRGPLLQEARRASARGLAWIERHFTFDDHPGGEKAWGYYMIYGLERAGTLLGVDHFGTRDWYVEGARWLIAHQDKEGSWQAGNTYGVGLFTSVQEEPDTCFALLFLRRASRPSVQTVDHFAERRQREVDPTEAVRLRAEGRTRVTAWIAGFAETTLAEHGGELWIARVEYLVNDEVVGSITADPTRPWSSDAFPFRHEFVLPGVHRLSARVVVRAADDEADDAQAAREEVLASRVIEVRSDGVLAPWMLACASGRGRNLLLDSAVTASASSQHEAGEAAGKALDGLQGTRWVARDDDLEPWLVIEAEKPIKADRIVLSNAAASADLLGRYDRIQEVSIRFNRDKVATTIVFPTDELQPAVLDLEKSVNVTRLELRVTRRVLGTDRKGRIGIAELALERRAR